MPKYTEQQLMIRKGSSPLLAEFVSEWLVLDEDYYEPWIDIRNAYRRFLGQKGLREVRDAPSVRSLAIAVTRLLGVSSSAMFVPKYHKVCKVRHGVRLRQRAEGF